MLQHRAGNGNAHPLYQHLRTLLSAGLSPLLLHAETKRPIEPWKSWQCRLPSELELLNRFTRATRNGRRLVGVGVIAGTVSGGLEILDFDDEGRLFPYWVDQCSEIASRLPIIRTPSGGTHVYWRCTEICGNSKIAKDTDGKTLIETRGEGGMARTVMPEECRPPNLKPYVQVSGPSLPSIPYISPDERASLWKAAAAFDQGPREADRLREQFVSEARASLLRHRSTRSLDAEEFIRRFNAEQDWSSILRSLGWTSKNGIDWTRPGKGSHGYSAVLRRGNDGEELLVVFSSNAGELAATRGHRTFNKFSAVVATEFGGDRIAALKQLNPLRRDDK